MRKKGKNKKRSKLAIFIGIIYLIVYISTFIYLYIQDIIPIKYYLLGLGITSVISLIIEIFLFGKKIKKKFRIISSILSVLLIGIYIIGIIYLNNTMNFIDDIKALNSKYEEFYVVVPIDSEYKKISDIEDEYVYIKDSKDEVFKEAKDKLLDKVDIEYKDLDNLDLLYDKIEEDGIIFLSSNNYKILSEDEYELKDISKILYKIKIKSDEEDNSKDVNITKESFNVYISGIDETGDLSNVSRSDVNMVVTVNPITNEVLMTSIPRDYYVTLHSYGSKDKLTHAGMYGVNESISTIEDLLDIDINYYAKVNFTTVIDLVDVIGGITVYSEYTFKTSGMEKSYSFVKGNNELDGQRALAYARERHSFADGDRQRVKNQQDVLTAIINKMTSSKTLLTSYSDILNTLGKSFQTNMGEKEIKALIKYQINDMPSWNIERFSLDGTDSSDITYTFGNQKLYVMEPDYDTVEEAKTNIQNVIEGE